MQQADIRISVSTEFVTEQQEQGLVQYAFAYEICIENQSDTSVQLLNRHWLITDGNGTTREVHGSGVVGKQPHIAPGESFIYTSGALLETPVGSMQGHYEMQRADGTLFTAPIEVFSLSVPHLLN